VEDAGLAEANVGRDSSVAHAVIAVRLQEVLRGVEDTLIHWKET